ncbi:AMP-binding protein [Nisaea sp.]|uniref:AMP-binding protein n=1 Tax=Nisaea sp. TaxID=2024842 RepID=UPI002B267DA7|nr:AMP-binding protein [Nisaea sp.]
MTEKFPQAGGIPARIIHIARHTSDRHWLTLLGPSGKATSLTYREFLRLAMCWAQRFKELKLAPGNTILILLDHSVDLYTAHCGALISGLVPAIFAPPSPKQDEDYYFQSLEQLITTSGAAAIVTIDELHARVKPRLSAALTVPVLTKRSDTPSSNCILPDNPNATAILQYSSGTTGLKKGVSFSHLSVLWQVDRHAKMIGLQESDTIVSWLPIYHDMGFVACYLTPLLRGVPLVVMSPFDWVKRPAMFLEAIETYRGTYAWQPNFAYNFLSANVPLDASYDLSSIRRLINCSEPAFDESHRTFIDRFKTSGISEEKLAVSYAMAENVFAVTVTDAKQPPRVEHIDATEMRDNRRAVKVSKDAAGARSVVSCGRPLPETSIKIVNHQRRPLKNGYLGEIAIRSPGLFIGYQGNKAATNAVLHDGWYYTGDLGYASEGELFVVGRTKDTIIVSGKNIFPEDLERAVSRVKNIVPGRCVAFGVHDSATGTERLVIVAESRERNSDIRLRLRQKIRDKITSENDIPVYDVAIADHMWLAKSTSGKISRQRNKERYLRDLYRPAEDTAQQDDSAETDNLHAATLKTTISALRGQIGPFADNVGPSTRLISSGMVDSLSLAVLFTALESRFALSLPETVTQDIEKLDTVDQIVLELEKLNADPRTVPVTSSIVTTNTDWHARISAGIGGWNETVEEIAPQMRDALSLGGAASDTAIAIRLKAGRGYASRPSFQSKSLNTDENGFRVTIIDAQLVPLDKFQNSVKRRGYLFGSSSSFGVGTSSDASVLHNRLNAVAGPDDVFWFNLSLRGSNLKTEIAAGSILNGETADTILFFSGLNDFRFFSDFVTGLEASNGKGMADTEIDALYSEFIKELTEDIRSASELATSLKASIRFCLQVGMPALDAPKPLSAEERKLRDAMHTENAAKFGDYWIVTDHYEILVKRFRQDLASICHKLQVDFYDPNNALEFRSSDWLFNDFWHYTDQGHDILCKLISSNLLRP